MNRNPSESLIRKLFELGERVPFSLPDPVTEGWNALERVRDARAHAQAQLDRPENQPDHMEEVLAGKAADAAFGKGSKLPTAKPFVDARDARDRLTFELKFLLRAEDVVVGRLVSTTADEGEAIISNHLKPPHAQVLSEARKLAPGLKGARTEAEVLGKDAREPWLKLQVLAQTYQSLHVARRTVVAIMGAESSDGLNQFTEFEDMDVLRPNLRTAAPWPEEGWAKLAWIATTPCKPWLPTPREQESRWTAWWKECGGEERARLHHQVHAMGGR